VIGLSRSLNRKDMKGTKDRKEDQRQANNRVGGSEPIRTDRSDLELISPHRSTVFVLFASR
jgi:hypothetical protein